MIQDKHCCKDFTNTFLDKKGGNLHKTIHHFKVLLTFLAKSVVLPQEREIRLQFKEKEMTVLVLL